MSNLYWYKYLAKLYLRDLLSFFVFIFLIIKRSILGDKDKGIRVLVYHSINEVDKRKDAIRITVTPELFRRQVEYLISRGYSIVSLDTIVEYISGDNNIEGKIIALTFDDGFGDNFNNSYNILKSRGLSATYFLTYDYIDSDKIFPWYTGNTSDAKPLTWKDVLNMASGGMTIGSHTLSHINLGSVSDDEEMLNKEIKISKDRIEEKTKSPVNHFAYPVGCRGAYDKKTEEMIRKSGYKSAYTNIFGENKKGDNIFELKRTRIDWNDTLFKFRMKIKGAYDWVDLKSCLETKI